MGSAVSGIAVCRFCSRRVSPGDASGNRAGGEFFTEHQKRLINRTWRYLANDLTGHGSKVFLRIFDVMPTARDLFPSLRYCQTHEQLVNNPVFKGHASRFMQAVGAVVDHIDDPEGGLSQLLRELGEQHVNFFGFDQLYFQRFSESMMYVWTNELGNKLTPGVRLAWQAVFDFIMTKMREGYEEGQEAANLRKQTGGTEREEEITNDPGLPLPAISGSTSPN